VRSKLSLHKRPDPATRPKVDPAKVDLSEALQMRFIDRDGRYIMQKLVVTYETTFLVAEGQTGKGRTTELSRTWIDVPLVPEAYFP
jgi:hypothetical protein